MKTKLFLIIAMFLSIVIYSQTPVSGLISGTWNRAGSPYLIQSITEVPDGLTLTIEDSVVVEFQGNYTMYINGQILAIGTASDSIIFTAADTSTGFNSIRFLHTPDGNDTSRFEYCVFEYGNAYGIYPENCGGAICAINYGKFIVDHCLFDHNRAIQEYMGIPGGGAIALEGSSPVIRNSRFINNDSYYGGALVSYNGSDPIIENNVFANNKAILNAGAIMCAESSDPDINHNLFYNNTSLGFSGALEIIGNCSPKIINNTIANNHASIGGGGLLICNECNITIKNTILWENSADSGGNQVYIYDYTNILAFKYCDIEDGEDEFGGVPFQGEYEDNIDSDPEFEDIEAGNYHLTEGSLCIDMGDPQMFDPDGTRCDIGAFYYDQTVGISGFKVQSSRFRVDCFPNPTYGISNVSYSLQVDSRVSLGVYDIHGKKIRTLVNEKQPPGDYTVRFDGTDLPAGIYFIRLKAGGHAETAKLVVMK